ncbi:hypothetical protein Q5H92_05700 [Hymenobacter sp. M29]|uniref:PH domain-containing protein n=1 Tax=Hymenobacter mellowenesis TaxID=3063995 RepID=A0ABT9AAT7_9BACT|nr:hypothetical protein [Hymenobacter sp. M29]MDO7845842.1 hypothetical protein [Hymenobacter sp. M29]
MSTVSPIEQPTAQSAGSNFSFEATGPACEAFAVRVGYFWLMVLASVAGLITGLINLVTQPSPPVLVLAAALLAVGYLAWQRGYRAVQLELGPRSLRIQPVALGQPAEELPLPRIANYLRPMESAYQILELQLHGGATLKFGKRMRNPGAGLLTLDAWTEVLAARLEESRPAFASIPVAATLSAAPAAANSLDSGLVAEPPRTLGRSVLGKVLAGVAIVWLLLAGLVLFDPSQHVATWVFLAPVMYLAYFLQSRSTLKTRTTVTTSRRSAEDDEVYEAWKNY